VASRDGWVIACDRRKSRDQSVDTLVHWALNHWGYGSRNQDGFPVLVVCLYLLLAGRLSTLSLQPNENNRNSIDNSIGIVENKTVIENYWFPRRYFWYLKLIASLGYCSGPSRIWEDSDISHHFVNWITNIYNIDCATVSVYPSIWEHSSLRL